MNRRGFLLGLIAAPAVIRTPGILMPIRQMWTPRFGTSMIELDQARQSALNKFWSTAMRRAMMESRWIADLEAYHGAYDAPKGDTITIRRPRMFTEEAA